MGTESLHLDLHVELANGRFCSVKYLLLIRSRLRGRGETHYDQQR